MVLLTTSIVAGFTVVFQTAEVTAEGVTASTLIGLMARSGLGRSLANGRIECPEPGTCTVGETEPLDCECQFVGGAPEALLALGQPHGAYSDFLDPASSPNAPEFWIMHNFYGMLYQRWADRAPEAPSEVNDYLGFPADNSEWCYGHGLSDTVSHNFCFTAADLELDECTGQDETHERNLHLNEGQCCTNKEILKYMLEDAPIQYDIQMSDFIWYPVEPVEKCSLNCSGNFTGSLQCLRSTTLTKAEDIFCEDLPKPDPPVKQCSCSYDSLRVDSLELNSEAKMPSSV